MYVAPGAPSSDRWATVAAAGGDSSGTRGIVIRMRGNDDAHVKRARPVMTICVPVMTMLGASTRIDPTYETVAPAIA
jgi:hypothetical protein